MCVYGGWFGTVCEFCTCLKALLGGSHRNRYFSWSRTDRKKIPGTCQQCVCVCVRRAGKYLLINNSWNKITLLNVSPCRTHSHSHTHTHRVIDGEICLWVGVSPFMGWWCRWTVRESGRWNIEPLIGWLDGVQAKYSYQKIHGFFATLSHNV